MRTSPLAPEHMNPDHELPPDSQTLSAWTLSQSPHHGATITVQGKSPNSRVYVSHEAAGTCNSGHTPHPGHLSNQTQAWLLRNV